MDIKDYIKTEGYYLGTVVGNSMRPLLRSRKDCVLIVPPEQSHFKKYQIILFETYNNYILHRIICVNNDIIITRGDNSHRVEFISNENVLGVLKGFYFKGKYIDCNSFLYKIYSRVIVKLNYMVRLKDMFLQRNQDSK